MIGTLCLSSSMVNAALIGIQDHGTYLTDTNSGLDWLDVTASLNMSYNDVSNQLSTGGIFEGWRYAAAAEFGGMASSALGVNTGITSTLQSYIVSEQNTALRELIALLGDTYYQYSQSRFGGSYCQAYPSDCPNGDLQFTYGLLSDPDPRPGRSSYISGGLISDDDRHLSSLDEIITHGGMPANYAVGEFVGSYLVRSTVTVPEPSALALLGIGLLALGFARKRKA